MPTMTYSGLSYAFYTGDGSTTTFPLGFSFLDESHVQVYVNGSQVDASDYSVLNESVVFVTAPAAADDIRLFRETPKDYDARLVNFRSFGSITEDEMDLNQKQIWYLIQEAAETTDSGVINPNAEYLAWDTVQGFWSGKRGLTNKTIGDVADPTLDSEVATKGYVDAVAEWGSAGLPQTWTLTTLPAVSNYTLDDGDRLNEKYLIVSISGVVQIPGIDFTVLPGTPSSTLVFTAIPPGGQVVNVQNFGKARFLSTLALDDNSVSTEKLQSGAVTSDKLDSQAVTSGKLADGAVTADKIGTSAVTSGKLDTGSVTLEKLATTGFTTAPGGSYNKYLRVAKSTGALETSSLSAADISDLGTELANTPLNTLSPPNNNLNLNSKRITALATPTAATDAANKSYVDAAVGISNDMKMVLLSDVTLAVANNTWTIINTPAPSWWTDSAYLFYTVAILNWGWPGSGKCLVKWYQSGAWREDLWFNPAVPSGFRTPWNLLIHQPRDASTKPMATSNFGTPAWTGWQPTLFGPSGGLQLRCEGNVIPAGARALIYGHKALA